MADNKLVMEFAEDINEFAEKEFIRKYYVNQSKKIMEDVFNHVVILLTMCVNRELQLALDVEDDNVSVEEYPEKIAEIYNEILTVYQKKNMEVIDKICIPADESTPFLEYLNCMVVCLLSGVRYIFKKEGMRFGLDDKINEWNTRYRREERIRDNMKAMFAKDYPYAKYTVTHNIEIPYMYVLAWDLRSVYKYFNEDPTEYKKELTEQEKNSYVANVRQNTNAELRHISNSLLDILLHGEQYDKEKEEDASPNAAIRFLKKIDYTSLLPTIAIRKRVKYGHDLDESVTGFEYSPGHIIPYIKKDILKKRPLLPMELDENEYKPLKAFEFMIGLMCEENKTRDYLNSDIVYLRDNIVTICERLLDWIWNKNMDFTTEEKESVEKYLISIIKSANNVPRKNRKEIRENYLKNLTREIADEWDKRKLNDEKLSDGNSEAYIRYAYFSVLKLTRNWFAHKAMENVSMSFTVFLFLISIRYLIDLDKLDVEYNREFINMESKLFKLLNKNAVKYDSINLAELDGEYVKLQENVRSKAFKDEDYSWFTHFPPKKVENDSYACIQRCPHQVLTAAGHSKSAIRDTMSEDEIFLTFWLTIHMGNNNTPKKIENSRDIDLLEILERTYEYQKKSSLLKEIEE